VKCSLLVVGEDFNMLLNNGVGSYNLTVLFHIQIVYLDFVVNNFT